MNELERLTAMYALADQVSALATKPQLAECGKLLGVICASYESRFGAMPAEEILDFLAADSLTPEQAGVVAKGIETFISVLRDFMTGTGELPA